MNRTVPVGKLLVWGAVAVPIIATIWILSWMWGLNVVHWFTTGLREHAPFWTPVGIGIAAAVPAIVWAFRLRPTRLYEKTPKLYYVLNSVAAGAVVLGLGAGIWLAFTATHARLHAYYEAATDIVTAEPTDYADRAPYEVAEHTSEAVLKDVTGSVRPVKSISEEGDHGLWTSLVLSNGPFNGYEAVQVMDLPLLGDLDPNKDVRFCRFDETKKLRDSGSMPHNNLSRAIFEQVPLDVSYQGGDVYGYCDGTTPIVVVPLTQLHGWWHPVSVFYGLAFLNGTTGEVTVTTDKQVIDATPGPTYPMSLAAIQRMTLMASEGWVEMEIEHSSGYAQATQNTEVQLVSESSGAADYVTTLMPRGSSQSIVGVSTVPAKAQSPGTLNTIIVSLFPDGKARASNKNLEQSLRTSYGNIPDIANDKLDVFEITIGRGGDWVLTLGREQSVSYRAYISADGKDIRLVNRFGETVSQAYSSEPGTAPSAPAVGDLTSMSDEELNTLGKAVLDELGRRLSK